MIPALAPLLLTVLPPQAAPTAGDPVAFYQHDGATIPVTRSEVATEMAFHLRRKDQGQAAIEHLVATTLVRRAARERDLWPSDAEVEALRHELQRQLQAQGRDLIDEPVVRNSGMRQLLEDLAVQLAHEKLVRQQLAMADGEPVSSEMLKLWIIEEKQRVTVVDDPDQLPSATAVRVGDLEVSLASLGRLLLRTSDNLTQDRFVRQVVALAHIEALGRKWKVVVTPDDLARELAARRAMAARDPRYQGMTFEQLLQSQGISLAWLRQSRVFRAQLLQKKVVAKLNPRDQLLEEVARDRRAVLDRAGPRRRLGIIFVRALHEPNELVERDFAAASAHLRQVRQRLTVEAFDTVARIESEGPSSKQRGGDLGWFHRSDQGLPTAVLEAAFGLPIGEVSEPVIGPGGCYLVKVLATEPMPTDDELITRLREQLADRMLGELRAAARITRVDGTRLDPEPGGQQTDVETTGKSDK